MDGKENEKTVDLQELCKRFGLPASEQQGLLAWTGEDPADAMWSEHEVMHLQDAWENDMSRNKD